MSPPSSKASRGYVQDAAARWSRPGQLHCVIWMSDQGSDQGARCVAVAARDMHTVMDLLLQDWAGTDLTGATVEFYGDAVVQALEEHPDTSLLDGLANVRPLAVVDLGLFDCQPEPAPVAPLEDRLSELYSPIEAPPEEAVEAWNSIKSVVESNNYILALEVSDG